MSKSMYLIKRVVVIAGAIFCSLSMSAHALIIKQSFIERIKSSDYVVVASVESLETHTAQPMGIPLIYTDVTLNVEQYLKGADTSNEAGQLKVQVLGGSLGDKSVTASDLPSFNEGENIVIFLKDTGSNLCSVVDGALGNYLIVDDAESGESVIRDSNGNPLAPEDISELQIVMNDTSVLSSQLFIRRLTTLSWHVAASN